MITVEALNKRFKAGFEIHDVSFEVPAGHVVGFVGRNGAGKSTVIRCLLGLYGLDDGFCLIDGKPLKEHARPIAHAGAVLGPDAMQGPLTGFGNLKVLAMANGISDETVLSLLREVGLEEAAKQKTSKYSLGMKQRLAIAAALLGEPNNLVLDEPFNGLDPEGVHWMRELIRERADRGAAVLVSSHMLSELEQIADAYILIDKGRLIFSGDAGELRRVLPETSGYIVETEDREAFVTLSKSQDWECERQRLRVLHVTGPGSAKELAQAASGAGILLTRIEEKRPSVEDAILALSQGGAHHE
ncbi:ATP-binding cassette domain-containing protein [Actinomycetaceae bacterium L2_0104]